MDISLIAEVLVRWIHVIAGIVWIGHLYFFNFVNIPFQGTMDKDTKQKVNPQLLPRALFWFRWGAMVTFVAGLILFVMFYFYTPGAGFGPNASFSNESGMTPRAMMLQLGMTFGIIMWFNVWFVIWPAQQKIIAAVRDGQGPDAALVKKAVGASKLNTYLSGPMLFGMLAPGHFATGLGTVTQALTAFAIAAAVAVAVVHHLYKVAPKVKGF